MAALDLLVRASHGFFFKPRMADFNSSFIVAVSKPLRLPCHGTKEELGFYLLLLRPA